MSHLPEITDGVYKTATEIAIETLLQEAKIDYYAFKPGFRFMMTEPQSKEVKVSELFKEYKAFVSKNMETSGRDVSYDSDEPEYEAMEVAVVFEEEDKRSWSSYKYATLDFSVDDDEQEDELNRTIRLSRWKNDKKTGWEIRTECNPAISSLRHLDKFDLLLVKLQREDVRLMVDVADDDDYVYSDTKPEATYE